MDSAAASIPEADPLDLDSADRLETLAQQLDRLPTELPDSYFQAVAMDELARAAAHKVAQLIVEGMEAADRAEHLDPLTRNFLETAALDVRTSAHPLDELRSALRDSHGTARRVLRAALSAAQDALRKAPRKNELLDRAKTLREWGLDLSAAPPPRRWLLRQPDPSADGTTSHGWLPLGKVGIFAADGGTGKTFSLLQLALAVATGADWFGMHVVAPGKVWFGLAEEDEEECRRRIYYAAKAMGLTDAQVELALSRIVLAPLDGIDVGLLELDRGGNAVRTQRHADLLSMLERSAEEWRLLIFDPLQSWAGVSTDRDNESAGRVIRAFAAFTAAPGSPTVLIAHHTSQAGNQQGKADASSIRGATGLVNTARWAATMVPRKVAGTDVVELRIVKSNYSGKGGPVSLVRDPDNGALRAWSTMERRRREHELAKQAAAAMEERVLQAIRDGHHTAKASVRSAVKGNRDEVAAAIARLEKAGRITKPGKGEPYHVVE